MHACSNKTYLVSHFFLPISSYVPLEIVLHVSVKKSTIQETKVSSFRNGKMLIGEILIEFQKIQPKNKATNIMNQLNDEQMIESVTISKIDDSIYYSAFDYHLLKTLLFIM